MSAPTTVAGESVHAVLREHIVSTPGVCGGKPRIAGHRVTVQNVVLWHERQGLTPHEIVATYPTLSWADVYAALAYYHDHRDEVWASIAADERFADELKAAQPPTRLQQA